MVNRPPNRSAAIEPLEGRRLFAAAPVPVSPGTAAGPPAVLATLAPTFSWSPVSGVNGYQVRVTNQTDGAPAVNVTVGPTVTQFTVPAGTLLPGRQFAWTVLDLIGSRPGKAHAFLHFATPVPPAPVALSPAGPASTVRPTLAWSAVPDVSGYLLHVYDKNTRQTITHTVPATATSYTFAAGAVQPGAEFAWNVRGLIGTKPARATSATLLFRLPALPTPITVGPGTFTGPGPVLDTSTPTFSWLPVTAVSGYSGYRLNLADRTLGRTTSITVSAAASSYTLAVGQLVARHQYQWDLRLLDGSLAGVGVSTPARFFVAPVLG